MNLSLKNKFLLPTLALIIVGIGLSAASFALGCLGILRSSRTTKAKSQAEME